MINYPVCNVNEHKTDRTNCTQISDGGAASVPLHYYMNNFITLYCILYGGILFGIFVNSGDPES